MTDLFEDKDWVQNDIDWSHKAWMSKIDADLCETILTCLAKSKNGNFEILEWGSGKSTEYFSNYLANLKIPYRWLSLEYNNEFFKTLNTNSDKIDIKVNYSDDKQIINPENFSKDCNSKYNIEYAVFNYGNLLPMLAANKKDRSVNMDHYVGLPGLLKRKYDFILVDGRHRRKCVLNALSWVSDDGVVILHDAYRPYYHSAFNFYPVSNFVGDILWVGTKKENHHCLSNLKN